MIVRPTAGAAVPSYSQPGSRGATPVQHILGNNAPSAATAPPSIPNGTAGSGPSPLGQQGQPIQQEHQGPNIVPNRLQNLPQQLPFPGMPFLHMPLQAQHAFQAAHGQQNPVTAQDSTNNPNATPDNASNLGQIPPFQPPAPDAMQQHEAIHQAAVRQAMGGHVQQPRVVGVHAQWRAAPLNFGPLGQLAGQPMPPGFPAPFALPQNIAQPGNDHQQQQGTTITSTGTPTRTTSSQGDGVQPQRGSTPVAGNIAGLPFLAVPSQFPPHPPMQNSPFAGLSNSLGHIRAQEQLMSVPNNMYILSSPAGPQAIVYSPHGIYQAQLPFQPALPGTIAPTNPLHVAQQPQAEANRQQANQAAPQVNLLGGQPVQHAAVAPQQQVANVANINNAIAGGPAPAEPPGLLQPLLAHFWMLIRILIFAYFFIGTDDGWRRPAILVAIGVAFFVLRGFDAGRGARDGLRRWWDGVVGLPQRQAANGNQAQGQQQNLGQGQDQANDGRAGQVRHQEIGQQAAAPVVGHQPAPNQNANDMSPLRQRLRPIERAIALFVASLWPGVGENTVRQHREAEAQLRREEAEALAASASASAAAAIAEGENPPDDENTREISVDDAGPAHADHIGDEEPAIARTSGAAPDEGAARVRKTFTHNEQDASASGSEEGSSAAARPQYRED